MVMCRIMYNTTTASNNKDSNDDSNSNNNDNDVHKTQAWITEEYEKRERDNRELSPKSKR